MNRLLITAVAVASFAQAQQPPSAAELFAHYVKALGGAEKILAISTRTMIGTMETSDDGSVSKVEVLAKAPNLYSITTTSGENEVSAVIFAGKQGWFSDPDSMRAMSGTELLVFAGEYDLHRAAHFSDLYPVTSPPRNSVLREKAAWMVEAKTPSGEVEKLYFDAATGLLGRRDFQRNTAEDGIINYQESYGDYRDVDGMMLPFLVRRVNSDEYEQIFKFTAIRHNVPVSDSAFTKPVK
jgi:outer membrane lipoprotein-sorting protein